GGGEPREGGKGTEVFGRGDLGFGGRHLQGDAKAAAVPAEHVLVIVGDVFGFAVELVDLEDFVGVADHVAAFGAFALDLDDAGADGLGQRVAAEDFEGSLARVAEGEDLHFIFAVGDVELDAASAVDLGGVGGE